MLPIVSTSVRVPLEVGANLYQTVLLTPVVKGIWLLCAHIGTGSVDWMVAPELSTVLVKEPPAPGVTVVALAKLSLAGGAATIVKVGRITIGVQVLLVHVTVVPPPGGGFCTPTELVLPKPPAKEAGMVACSDVELTKVVGMGVPPTSGFISTTEFAEKPVPVTVIDTGRLARGA